MRFLIDMPLSLETAVFLRQLGHDVVHARERGLQRAPDEQIFRLAGDEDRIVLTMDLGFGHLLAFANAAKPSVLLLRLADARPERVHELLQQHLPSVEADLSAGAIVVLTEAGLRAHRLPIRPD